MKNFLYTSALLIFSLTACTLTPWQTSATAAPLNKITAADVHLPFDGSTAATIKYMPCFVNTKTGIPAAGVFYFNDFSSDTTIHIVAPAGGLVVYVIHRPDSTGQNIIVKTDFVYQKETVYYQLSYFHELALGVSVGSRINQGDTLGYIDNDGFPFDPLNGYRLDIGFFTARPSVYDGAAGNSADIEKYIDPGLLLGDSLDKFPLIDQLPGCQ